MKNLFVIGFILGFVLMFNFLRPEFDIDEVTEMPVAVLASV